MTQANESIWQKNRIRNKRGRLKKIPTSAAFMSRWTIEAYVMIYLENIWKKYSGRKGTKYLFISYIEYIEFECITINNDLF